MASLYKRATPSQARLLRIIAGAYKNVCDAHGIEYDPRLGRSIAKRAAGTASSQWKALLAATPGMADGTVACIPGAQLLKHRPPQGQSLMCPNGKGGVSRVARRSPLRLLHNRIGHMAGAARKAGEKDRQLALEEVLRLIAEQIKDA